MVRWNVVTRDDLLRWADAEGAPGQLPELVRRLIHETARESVEALDFPGGSGVTSGGFDGFARSSSGTPFVPAGPSVWELSVRKDAARKADEDIVKRDAVPDGSPVDQATYVQVISRAWTTAANWGCDWTATSAWKRVEGYNVDRLTTWVEQAPATRIWLLERLGKPVVGVVSGSDWWHRWSTATEPVLTPELVLARGIGDLRPALGRTGVTTVGGAVGVNEIIACVVAAAVEGDLVDRVVVVDDRSAWQRLLKEVSPLVLVATDAGFGDDVGPDVQHTVVLPVPQSDDSDVVLERADSERLAEALQPLTEKPSHELGALARRSFVSFRRRIAHRPELMTPPWAVGAVPRPVRAALLLVEWSDTSQADRDVVAALAAMPYEAVREELLRYTVTDDPLLALTTDRWLLVSPADAWQQLGRHLLTDDLDAFAEQAKVVLAERDPALDLPRAERWRAGIDGKVLQHSHALRKGVASGLALLGTYGDRVVAATGVHGEHWAGRVLRPLLEMCNADRTGDRWASLAELLPILVEAAPGELLEAFRIGASGDDPMLAAIFQDDPDESSLFDPASPHMHFLWALETAAWSTDHVGAAVDLLAALVTLDPGGRISNRPSASLANIFCSWHPDTAADVEQRLAIIDRLRKRWPAVAEELLVGLLPVGMQGFHFPMSEPSFRDWKPAPYVVLMTDHWRVVEGALERLLEDAAGDSDRWSELLQAYQHLPAELRTKVRDAASTLDPHQLPAESRRGLWEDLRKLVAHNREYPDANWALADEELGTLGELAATFEPESPEDRHQWLFLTQRIELGDATRRDFDAYDQEVANRRAEAMKEIVAHGGLEAVASFAATADAAVVGAALAQATPNDETTSALLEWYQSGSDTNQVVAASYLWQRGWTGCLEWSRQLLAAHPELSAAAQAEILHDANSVPEEWDEARARGEDVEREYWRRYRYTGRGHDFQHVLTAANRMMGVGRWAAALDMLSMHQPSTEVDAPYAEAVATALEGLLTSTEREVRVLDTWDYERAFAVLDAHVGTLGLSRVTQLQWGFLPALGYNPPTTTLHRALANDPAFFVEVLGLVYRAKGADRASAHPGTDPGMSEIAWRLLQSWRVAPGRSDDGTFDVGRTRAWIDETRRLLVEADRLDVGLGRIGEVLIHTPEGDAGWPSTEMAELIEGLDDDKIDNGILIGLRNARGGTSRSLTEGGEQERTLAVDFRQRALQFRDSHPRVGRILNTVAESYEADARREDRKAERQRRGLDR